MASSSALQWWQEHQHVLVLSSLGVQCYLAFFARGRSRRIGPLYRFSIWLAYLGGDALAIYALAVLFISRQRKLQYNYIDGSHGVEALWAPILLWHLQINITAYHIEDNELWSRHALTAVAQVTVALYVFCMSWSSSADKRLLVAAILLFIIAAFKCFGKSAAQRRASFTSIATRFRPAPRTDDIKNPELELEKYIQEARDFVKHIYRPRTMEYAEKVEWLKKLSIPDKLFVDYAYDYPERLMKLKLFWLMEDEDTVHNALSMGLSNTFDLIYSRYGLANVCAKLQALSNLLLPIVPIVLFHSSHKNAYTGTDIKVTFISLYITYFLEIWSFFKLSCDCHPSEDEFERSTYRVGQCSLVGMIAWNRRHTRLVSMAEFFQCKGLLDIYFGLRSCRSSKRITIDVREHVKDGWKRRITDIESYWRFSDSRGQWALERHGREQILLASIEKPFDESIILWHVATVFCCHERGWPFDYYASTCRKISNYMMHLLFANPEMLSPGARRNLFTDAYHELEDILEGDDLSQLDERRVTLRIIEKAKEAKLPEGFIQDSWILAQELMRRDGMWGILDGVWIEMLCFSAGRCRGYLHSKSLGSGSEYLSYVSLLLSHAGLETYAERQQRVHLRLPKELRQHIVRVKAMKNEIEEAATNMQSRIMERAAGASAEVKIVIC